MEPTDYARRKMKQRGITMESVGEALQNIRFGLIQEDGRHCFWGWSERRGQHLRIIVSPGTDRLINAFPDSNFNS